LVDLYLAEASPAPIIDLTGGQPDLVPEWVLWMMYELRSRDLDHVVYLWSDDNLSNDFFWRFLTEKDHEFIASYPFYGRVCCFKGFNEESFAFNTCAAAELFAHQFFLMKRLLDLGIDLYGYVTFTTPTIAQVAGDMRSFVDSLQELDPLLPLRIVPLEIKMFTPVKARASEAAKLSLQNQQVVVETWQRELESRFTISDRSRPITSVPLKGRRQHHDRGLS
jgi:hypothetical protein